MGIESNPANLQRSESSALRLLSGWKEHATSRWLNGLETLLSQVSRPLWCKLFGLVSILGACDSLKSIVLWKAPGALLSRVID
jgi:hypothetical protein